METVLILPFWFEFAAVLTGGLSGAMSAVRARYDVFGCIVIACATGLGGGITRDVLLQDYGIYAFQNPSLLLMCVLGAIVVFYFGKLATYLDPIVDLLDNLSVSMWAIIGAGKSLSAGLGIVPSIILGTITAIGGGIMRDVLMNKTPEAFKAGPLYGSAALFGCTAYCVMHHYDFFPNMAAAMCATLVLGIRYASLALGWRTHEPRDYSDAVTDAVKRPVAFIARKAHVPMGKTAHDRKNTRMNRFMHYGKRAYERMSGQWMTRHDVERSGAADATAKAANRIDGNAHDDIDSGAPVPEEDCVHWDAPAPEADVSEHADELAAVAKPHHTK